VLADAPVAYWRIGETIAPSADEAPAPIPARLFGEVSSASRATLGDGNPAMLFNGSTGYVGSPTVQPCNWRATFTIEMWINYRWRRARR